MPLEIAPVRRPPVRQRAVTFAFIKRTNASSIPLNRLWTNSTVSRTPWGCPLRHHALPHIRDGPIADGPIRGALSSRQDQLGDFVAQRRVSPNENRSRARQFILLGTLILAKIRLTEPCLNSHSHQTLLTATAHRTLACQNSGVDDGHRR